MTQTLANHTTLLTKKIKSYPLVFTKTLSQFQKATKGKASICLRRVPLPKGKDFQKYSTKQIHPGIPKLKRDVGNNRDSR